MSAAPRTLRAVSMRRITKVIAARITTGCVRSPNESATFFALTAISFALRMPITARKMPTPAPIEILMPRGIVMTIALRMPSTVTMIKSNPLRKTIALATPIGTFCSCTIVIEKIATLPMPGARAKGRFVYSPIAIVAAKIISTMPVSIAPVGTPASPIMCGTTAST